MGSVITLTAESIDSLPPRGELGFNELAYLAGCAGCINACGSRFTADRSTRSKIAADVRTASDVTGIPVTIFIDGTVHNIGEPSRECASGDCSGEEDGAMEIFHEIDGVTAI